MSGESQPSRLRLKTLRDWLWIMFSGVCMGITEMIPGISGGTTAFIMGFWHDLLDSIKSFNLSAFKLLLTGRFRDFFAVVEWRFLLALGIGDLLALCLLAQLVTFLLGHEVYRSYLYGGFFGLITASIIFCSLKINKWHPRYVVGLIAAALAAFALTHADWKSESKESVFDVFVPHESISSGVLLQNYDREKQVLKSVPQTTLEAMLAKSLIKPDTQVYSHSASYWGTVDQFVTKYNHYSIDWQLSLFGALAIVAMLLPGISGSYVLMILGKYALVVGALADFVSATKSGVFEKDAFFVLLSLTIGVIGGALLFSRLVSALLRDYHDAMMSLLTGCMVGSLPAIWPFWSFHYILQPLKLDKGPQLVVESPVWPGLVSVDFWITFLICVVGIGVVLGCEYIASHKRHQPIPE